MCPAGGARSDAKIVNAMDKITLKDYRCFHEEQTARLAPLTLLVGENSTGKTSFLALIRALWDVAFRVGIPDFKEDPYDLGSFDEIAHHRGGKGGRAKTFEAGFHDISRRIRSRGRASARNYPYTFEVAFGKRGTTPIPVRRRQTVGETWIEENFKAGQFQGLKIRTRRGSWKNETPAELIRRFDLERDRMIPLSYRYLRFALSEDDKSTYSNFMPLCGSPVFSSEDLAALEIFDSLGIRHRGQRPFASAPVRSKPRRTYDPSLASPDPEGDYVPMYLANLLTEDEKTWPDLKKRLEGFGNDAGLFDEITIKQIGKKGSEPFQVQVRKFEGRRKGPLRNLIDVGYGVSQVLPVITELLLPNTRRRLLPRMFLLQQPEVHLHPSAQAALGSLFCEIAGSGQQIVVETHSDYLIDRVRIEVRNGEIGLRPEDVSILFFERDGLEVNIHSLTIDEDGNIDGQPENYRKFFMEEIQRSLGL